MYTHEVMAGLIVPPAPLTPSAVSSQPPQRVDVSNIVKLDPSSCTVVHSDSKGVPHSLSHPLGEHWVYTECTLGAH